MLAGLITGFYCACGLNYKYVLCLRDVGIYCACEVVYCFAPVARCVLLGLVVFRVSQLFLTRLFSVSSFKLSRVVFLVWFFSFFSGPYTQVFLVIRQRPIASFKGANSEA